MFPTDLNEQAYFEAKLAVAKRRSATTSEYEVYRDDPVGYVENVLHGLPWSKQTEIALSVAKNKRTLVKTGHGIRSEEHHV